MHHKHLQVSVVALAMSISGYSFAGGYVGAGIGLASSDSCDDAFSFGYTSCDDEDTGFKVLGGYNVNENFAVEGSYIDFGEATATDIFGTDKAEPTAFTISGKGMIPLNESISIFGKVGIAFWDVDISWNDALGSYSDSEDGTDLTFGLGAEFSANKQFSIRGEWERVDFDDIDTEGDLLSISAIMKF